MSKEVITEIGCVQRGCTYPNELSNLFIQWKQDGTWPSPNMDVDVPYKLFTFGVCLASNTYPSSLKYPLPQISLSDASDGVERASMLSRKDNTCGCYKAVNILLNGSWLKNPENKKHNLPDWTNDVMEQKAAYILIAAGVEEYAHWVFQLAIEKYRDVQYQNTISEKYKEIQSNFYRSIEIASSEHHIVASAGFLKKIFMIISGEAERRLETSIDAITKAKLENVKMSATLEEYMGVVWRNGIAQKYYPWTSLAEETREELKRATINRRLYK